MRNTWTRAWLATLGLLIALATFASSRHGTLLEVEEPVMDWLLTDSDTTVWDRARILESPWLVFGGTAVLSLITLKFNRVVAATIALTMMVGISVGLFTRSRTARPRPEQLETFDTTSFPSLPIIHTGIFFGLLVLVVWWFGAPRLVWHIFLEASIVAVLVVAIRRIVEGHHWPSDAVGSALVIALSLISAAIIFEDRPLRTDSGNSTPDRVAVG